jgi:transposase InsO family protein
MRYQFIKDHINEFPVGKMCKVMQVSKSAYYKWQTHKPGKRAVFNSFLTQEIKNIHRQSKCRYGSPRIAKELNMQGIKASVHLVAKLMREQQIKSIIKKRYKVTTNSSHKYAVAENKLMQQFSVVAKNKVWVSDITYIATRQGWLYLTSVIDLMNRKVIGWALSATMHAKHTSIAAFNMALINSQLKPTDELIFHSDRGIQYACEEFTSHIKKHPNITTSMSRKGNCWDNAIAESFFKTLKVELVYHHQYQTRQQAELSIFEYIETFYNTVRRHKQLNNLTILEHQQLLNNKIKHAA